MILESADIAIQPGQNAQFEVAVTSALNNILSKSEGFCSYQLRRGIESPNRYLLHILWETLEDHTVGFRQSPLYNEWRAAIGHFFATAPSVEHFEFVAEAQK
jgi:heme-degrading monooxygenase HmoA